MTPNKAFQPTGRPLNSSVGRQRHMDSRTTVFQEGVSYRVIRSCEVNVGKVYQLQAGEIVVFYRYQYSHYDNLSVYWFRTLFGADTYWALHDDQPEENWKAYFEKV